jgi:acyl-CoA thioesterase-1
MSNNTEINVKCRTMAQENICIFGDSIVWGAHRLPSRVAWVNLLRNELESANRNYRVYDLGIDMDTTKQVIERFDIEAKSRKPTYLIFDIGVNDSLYRDNPENAETTPIEFEQNIQKLIEKARAFTKKIMFIGLVKGDDKLTNPLPQSTTGKIYTKDRVSTYNSIIRGVCDRAKISFVDVYPIMDDTDFSDGLHPNETGHKKMFEIILGEFEKLLIS